MMLGQFAQVNLVQLGQIHPDPAGDQNFADARFAAGLAQQLDQRSMIGSKQFTYARVNAGKATAFGFHIGPGAAHLVHVGGGPTHIADHAAKIRVLRQFAHLGQNGFLATRLDDAPLVRGDRAKSAAPKTPAHNGYRVLDHLVGGDGFGVRRMGSPVVRQAEDAVHFRLREGQTGRIAHHRLVGMVLDQSPGVERVGVVVNDPRGLDKSQFVGGDRLEGRDFLQVEGLIHSLLDKRQGLGQPGPFCFGGRFRGPQGVSHPPQVSQVARGLSGCQTASDFNDVGFAHPINDQVSLAVQKDRFPDRVGPIVVMCQTTQGGLDPASNDWHAGKRLPGPVAVGQRGPVGPESNPPPGGIGVVVAHLLVGGVMIDHRVHVARADSEEQPRPTELPPRLTGPPVWLAENGHPESCVLQNPVQNRHGKAGVVDIGIPGDKDHINGIPPPLAHLLP